MGGSGGAPSFPLIPLLLLGCADFLAGRGSGSSASHSMRYFYAAVSEPGEKVPQFFLVGYVDDQQFLSYDAKAGKYISKAPWMTKVEEEDPQHAEQNNRNFQNSEQASRVNLMTVAKYYNQSGGTHTWQKMYGCELRRDGSKGGYRQYAYDGRDYISFDKETLTYTAADVLAQITKRKWDANLADNRYKKAYLEEICIEWLQRYLEYGKESLLRTEKPEVKVTRKVEYDGMETLICHVRGFYPKEIDITWTKDGEVWMQDTYHGLVSPNLDGTYYTWWSIMVDPEERERYKCHVEHDGLLKPVDVTWEEPASILWVIIEYVVVGVLVVLAVGIAVYFRSPLLRSKWILANVLCKRHTEKRQNGYKAASVSDQGSNSSGTGSAVPI